MTIVGTDSPFVAPEVSDTELNDVDRAIQRAQIERSVEHLRVLGLGEISVAVGWPTDEPLFVAKRLLPSHNRADAQRDVDMIIDFARRIEANGGRLVGTDVRVLDRDGGGFVPYLLQPVIPGELLAERLLETETPAVDHPVLVALCNMVTEVNSADFAIDPQVPNFAWHDDELWLFDFSTPMTFDSEGRFNGNFDSGYRTLPAVLKPVLRREVAKIFGYYRSPTHALTQTVVFLKRIGADDWVDPAMATFNTRLPDPIDRAQVDALYERQIKEFPRLKQLARVQRAWQENVRRRPYEYLITDSFSGRVL